MTAAAITAAVLAAVVGIFQLALAFGAPLGSAAWGGQHAGVLPWRFRIASGMAAFLVYPLIMLLILASTGLIEARWLPTGRIGMWVLTGFFTLGAVANLASRSRIERIWGPVSLVIAVCCAIVAVSI